MYTSSSVDIPCRRMVATQLRPAFSRGSATSNRKRFDTFLPRAQQHATTFSVSGPTHRTRTTETSIYLAGNNASQACTTFFSPGFSRLIRAGRLSPTSRARGCGLGREHVAWTRRSVTCSLSRTREQGSGDKLEGGKEIPIRETLRRERLILLETNIDDLSPQVMAYAMEELLAAGGLDVWAVPILMKKGRPATKINVLCEEELVDAMIRILLTVSPCAMTKEGRATARMLDRFKIYSSLRSVHVER